MLAGLFLFALVFFLICYRLYGRFLARLYGLDDSRKTPAAAMYDGMDYVPTHPSVLLGHHFSSIAGAGPIVGPITAAAWFGWLPAYIWCLLGSAFLGGPHDAGSLIASIRHKGRSMGEVVQKWIGEKGRRLFLTFSVLTLILIVAVFLDLAAKTMAANPVVAFSACLYMVLAVIFGLVVYRWGLSLKLATLILLPITLGSCWFAHNNPWLTAPFVFSEEAWRWMLIIYIALASLLPVWLLLQPRDYLASYLLYFAIIIGAVGMIFGGSQFEVTLPAFKGFVHGDNQYLWPILFVTVACGAISGFHSMVGSGTTSKQLRKETDSIFIGYGGMLIEGMVAVIALGTVMIAGGLADGETPVALFSKGFGQFCGLLKIDPVFGASLGALAINSFILTTLDTATRLTRYQIQEFSGGRVNRYLATLIAIVGAYMLLELKSGDTPTFKLIWPVFGSANQLVAALALLALGVWTKKALNKNSNFLMIPMWFMLFTTIAALGILIWDQFKAASVNYVVVCFSGILMILAVLMVREAMAALSIKNIPKP